MPRVLATYRLRGRTAGFAANAYVTAELFVLDDGPLVGSVAQPRQWFVENGKASVDFVESTATTVVYTCRFDLVHIDGANSERRHVTGRLSQANGLVGTCRLAAADNEPGFPIHLVPTQDPGARQLRPAPLNVSRSPRTTRVNAEVPPVVPPRIFRGDQVDAVGEKYAATLFLTLHPDSRLEGTAHESGRVCPFEGTWVRDTVLFWLKYPHKRGVVHVYQYEGKFVRSQENGTRLVGRWRFDTNANQDAYGEVLEGIFDLREEEGHPAANTRSHRTRNAP